MSKMIYHFLNVFSKRKAMDYAIKQQILSTKNKDSLEWYYWYEKIMG
mgnify:CR=1 FL=1